MAFKACVNRLLKIIENARVSRNIESSHCVFHFSIRLNACLYKRFGKQFTRILQVMILLR